MTAGVWEEEGVGVEGMERGRGGTAAGNKGSGDESILITSGCKKTKNKNKSQWVMLICFCIIWKAFFVIKSDVSDNCDVIS